MGIFNWSACKNNIVPLRRKKYLIYFLLNLLLNENHLLKNRELHIQYLDTVSDTVNPQDDTVNDTVFKLIRQNNNITAIEISKLLNISLSTVKRKTKKLKEQNRIERIGSDKTGYWKIVE